MRLDHLAYRVKNREKTVNFFEEAFGYKKQTDFELKFDDGTTCNCTALTPPEKNNKKLSWIIETLAMDIINESKTDYHLAPEIFVSEGQPNSIVEQWVNERSGVGGIHHLAYQVDNVEEKMKEWKEKGYAEFCSDEPLTCPGLTQVFTKPSELTGIIYEFITRGEHGFCAENVKQLMESTVIQS